MNININMNSYTTTNITNNTNVKKRETNSY